MKRLAIAAGIFWAGALSAQPELTVYTYESFFTEWGPGPRIKAAFEDQCDCRLNLLGIGDGATFLARLRLEGTRNRADVVLGLDTNQIAAARETGLFAPSGVEADYDLPVTWDDPVFVPYDWSLFAFVHRKETPAPGSFRELADSDLKIIIQDPRSSTPGLGLLLWVRDAYGDEAPGIWKGLADNIVTVTPGWSESYGLFLDGESDMVLSWTTSPAYHRIAEDDDSIEAALFSEGNYAQIEVAARLKNSREPELAQEFLQFLLSDKAQAAFMTGNWMYPAVLPPGGLAEGFDPPPPPEKVLLLDPGRAAALRDEALAEWLDALSR
ncbi:thiamine ABC transporter substrate binding subunit [Pontibaca methylaminivorans]|uniref:Thiamine transport system substrate-binding protein n=1 Tax=Pontibaca methylaminivorans TaxID=515897 RepID=A0A1R3WFL0_9RHOB|nr:thiamine ABC transporter substrate binding subunit [Pontibaca methylaminivorans]SIT76909.1 thiamine transport system substrate-binding protein [Pontibaca methylaminivorans]